MARILIADDEEDFRASVAESLRDAGHEVRECANGDDAIDRMREETFDVLLTDLRMPGRSGIDLLREAAARLPDSILIVLTAYGSLDTAIEALRIGAHDYILKPTRIEALLRKVDLLVRHQAAIAENRFLRGKLEIDVPSNGIAGSSDAIKNVLRLIAKVAPTDSSVLVTGETGTGKELVSRAIHQASPRHDLPFVTINCGSIPEMLLESELFGHTRGAFTGADREKRGLFEVAGAGTIVLDEIGELPMPLQPKLLRTLENREILRVGSTSPIKISARIVAATNRDLRSMVDKGSFRLDLYYRLNVFEIPIPPLRERVQDIREIITHLMDRLCRRLNRPVATIDPDALRALELYRWPGNVRELANVLERGLILADGPRIGIGELPGILTQGAPPAEDDLKAARKHFESAHVRRVIEKYGGDKQQAARALGIDLSSLYRKLQE
ncbi:MAG: sigma-54-dependent Fis family transcriptional regulator [Planctomycetes bacterium]|nr:sigma-54-dependent Fis family transcriptional regulator [Planctomycetota bacterium]MBI3847615.1 sigma-54-dependent Fis family transcriptional regulator [Planctomycetota bacterium]